MEQDWCYMKCTLTKLKENLFKENRKITISWFGLVALAECRGRSLRCGDKRIPL